MAHGWLMGIRVPPNGGITSAYECGLLTTPLMTPRALLTLTIIGSSPHSLTQPVILPLTWGVCITKGGKSKSPSMNSRCINPLGGLSRIVGRAVAKSFYLTPLTPLSNRRGENHADCLLYPSPFWRGAGGR